VSVKKCDNGYTVRWRTAAGAHQRTLKGATKAEAQAFEREQLRNRWQAGPGVSEGRMLFGEYLEEWITRAEIAPSTRRSYNHSINKIKPFLGPYEMRQLSVPLVARFRSQLEAQSVGPAMVRKTLSVVQSCMRDAVLHGYLDRNFAAEVPKPTVKRQRAVRPVMPEQVEAARLTLPPEKFGHSVLVAVLAYAGLRPQEALSLTWGDVGAKSLTIYSPKTDRTRSVPLLAPLAEDLNAWRQSMQHSSLVFPRPDGDRWTETDWRNYRRRTYKDLFGQGSYPYELRHTLATLMIYEGRPIMEVAAILGHSPQVCLSTYAHVLADFDYDNRIPAEEQIARARLSAQEAVCGKRAAVAA
jgi:hypothetical protein